MHNPKAVSSVFFGLLALTVLVGIAVAARYYEEVGLVQVAVGVGVGLLLSLVSLSLARRARFDYQRRLGRIGGAGVAAFGRVLGLVALLISITAALAFGVFAVLTLVLD